MKNLVRKILIATFAFSSLLVPNVHAEDTVKIIDIEPAAEEGNSEEIEHIIAGNEFFAEHKYDQAIAEYTLAIELKPDDDDAYYNRGLAYSSKGDSANAIADFEKITSLRPDFADAYNNLGILYYNLGDFEKAVSNLTKTIELNSDNETAYFLRGAAYSSQQKYDEAIQDFEKTVAINPNNFEAYNNLGILHYNRDEFDLAIENLSKAIGINPTSEEYYIRGVSYAMKQDFKNAAVDFAKTLELDPNDENARKNLEICQQRIEEVNSQ